MALCWNTEVYVTARFNNCLFVFNLIQFWAVFCFLLGSVRLIRVQLKLIHHLRVYHLDVVRVFWIRHRFIRTSFCTMTSVQLWWIKARVLAGLRSSSQLACLLHNLSPESGRWIRRLSEWRFEYKSNAEREQIGPKNSVCLGGTVAHTSAPCRSRQVAVCI